MLPALVPGMTLNFGQVRGSSIREPWGVMWSPRSGACVIASCVGAPFYRRIPRLLFLSPSSPLASPLVSLLAISPPLVFVSLSPSSSPLLLRRVVLRVCASSCTHSRACFLCETRTGRNNRLQGGTDRASGNGVRSCEAAGGNSGWSRLQYFGALFRGSFC